MAMRYVLTVEQTAYKYVELCDGTIFNESHIIILLSIDLQLSTE